MSTSRIEAVEAIERACAALMKSGSPAVVITCQEILERCYLMRWYEGQEQDPVPFTTFEEGTQR